MSIEVDLTALTQAAASLREGSTALEHTAASVPSGVDGGVMTALIAELLEKIVESAGNLSTGLAVSADNLEATRDSYSRTDESARDRVGIR